MTLEIDFETRSPVDIRKHGAYVYFEHPETRPHLASYIIDGGPLKRWRYPDPCPADVRDYVEAGGSITAHNASFERLLWQMILTPRYGWPVARLEQFRCTAATAAALSLPRDLFGLGKALDLAVQKDKDGTRLIRKFSIPRKPKKGEPEGLYWNEPEDHPEDFELFHNYCDSDVLTEANADGRMVPLSSAEQELYWIDQRINDRGLRVDLVSARSALALADRAKHSLDAEIRDVTGGYVLACSQVGRLTDWIQQQGVDLGSLGKAEIEELLETDDLPAHVRKALELRQEAAKTSVSKLEAFINRASSDGRVRGAYLFCGAGTGRWSSTGVQFHNLPRPRKEFGDAHLDQRVLFETIREGSPDWLRYLYGDTLGRPLWLLSDAIRGFLWAGPGSQLLVADYSGIEGAVAAWFAGEDWKVKALHDIIANSKLPDMYRRTAAGIFNCTTDDIPKSDSRRQVGKVAELSLGYQGGVGAFRSMARNYSLKLDPLFEPAWEAASGERREKAVERYEECLARNEPTTQTLTKREWIGAELVKVGWRATHPAIKASWKALEEGVQTAVLRPGEVVRVLKCQFIVRYGFLWCMLPSGRCLAYGHPAMRAVEVPWADKTQPPEKRETRPVVTALGVNSMTKKWERYALYGGLIFENVVQATARDLQAEGIRQAEKAGYPVIGHTHDEIITEVPKGWGDVKEFERLICQLPPWAAGLPLTAAGWRGKRYRKD